MAITVLNGIDEVRAAAGTHLGTSDWTEVTAERVRQFAEATGDQHGMQTDAEGARAPSPGGGTLAHGFLILAMTNDFLPRIVDVRGVSMGVNYGVDRVRFPAPVPVGSQIRAAAELLAVDDVTGGIQTTMRISVEVAGADEPACVVDALSRFYP